jgi:solute carrier family 35 protein F1/2
MSIPIALALTCLLLKVRYKIMHIVGISISLMGVGCLVWADTDDGRTLMGGKYTYHTG